MANPVADPAANLTQDLLTYLDAGTSPFHVVTETASRLLAAGFVELRIDQPWKTSSPRLSPTSGRCFVRLGGALVAWQAPATKPGWTKGVNIIGAHTDSPNLRVKPNPDVQSVGYRQVGVEVYGGVLNNSWLDRDLGVSGRFVMRDGSSQLVRVDRPVARIPQLAIHLDREVNDRGLVLDKQTHLLPVIGLGDGNFLSLFADQVADLEQISAWDLMFHDLTPAALLGQDNEFLASSRIDNLFSCWAATTALVAANPTLRTQMIALFDHEEVGSASTSGAAGPLLERVLMRLFAAAGLDADQQAVALSLSSCVSSDMAHAVHPNYADRHEPLHRPLPNGGPVIKSNANQRYASSADTMSLFREACRIAGVPVQVFVSKNSMPCGSTIGPITATRLGIDTVDVGCAMLSMHSARELCGAFDAALMVAALGAYLA
jgi:aspartyl aminopeptidase